MKTFGCSVDSEGRLASSHRKRSYRDPTKHDKGFSLIELIAVISIISIMLFLTLPRFDILSQPDDLKTASRWIMTQVPHLKAKAVSEQKPYVLLVNLDKNAFHVGQVEAPGAETELSEADDIPLGGGVKLTDVMIPGKGAITSGQVMIYFYKKGYSDKAIIHMKDGDNNVVSLTIEPFMASPVMTNGYIGFDA